MWNQPIHKGSGYRKSDVATVGIEHSTTTPLVGQSSATLGMRRDPGEELRAATAQANSWAEWLQHAARLTPKVLHAVGVFVCDPHVPQQALRLWGLTFPVEGLAEDRRQSLWQVAERATATNQIAFGPFGNDATQLVAAIKLLRSAESLTFVVLLDGQGSSRAEVSIWLTLIATSAELWSTRHESAAASRSTSAVRPQSSPVKSWSRTRTALVLGFVAAVVMAVPVPYSVNCDCELQPVVRRFVAAPFEGALEKAFVEVGDTVQADQLLARMDGKEVRWEQAGNAAEYERAAKERDAHLADQEFGEAQLAKLQMERLALTTKLLDHRNEHLEIRSPIDGIVVSGELKRAEGIRLSMGQTLFEVSPLDQMIVEVEIPEAELAHVATGATATIRLEAFFGQQLDGTLKRICPRAELRRKQQVFVGEIALPNDAGRFRPGMRGRVSIPAGYATLGWRLFHRAWQKLQLW